MAVSIEKNDAVWTIILHRPEVRNAVDQPTRVALQTAFEDFEADDAARVAVFWGKGGHFCAGADLKAMSDPTRRKMIDAGCAVALATDFNPGSSHTQSMTMIHTIACTQMKMSVEECIVASTINTAFSLQLDQEVGTLHPGKRADLCVLDVPSHQALGYAFGGNPVAMTIKDGVPVVANVADRQPDWFGDGVVLDGEGE